MTDTEKELFKELKDIKSLVYSLKNQLDILEKHIRINYDDIDNLVHKAGIKKHPKR